MSVLITESLGMIANVLSNVAFIPQIIKSYRTKSVNDLSMGMFLTLLITQLCWIGYAIPLGAWELWTSSLIEIILLVPIFVMWLMYHHSRDRNTTESTTLLSSETNIMYTGDA